MLTVLVDLIVSVGIGVSVVNVLNIEHLTLLRAKSVQAIADADDAILCEC